MNLNIFKKQYPDAKFNFKLRSGKFYGPCDFTSTPDGVLLQREGRGDVITTHDAIDAVEVVTENEDD